MVYYGSGIHITYRNYGLAVLKKARREKLRAILRL